MKTNITSLRPYKPNPNTYEIILDANENPKDINKQLLDKIQEAIGNVCLNRYPDSDSTKLRKAYGKYAGVKAENVICGNGSDEIIKLLLECFVDKGDNILITPPTFTMYEISNKIVGGNTFYLESEDEFKIDVDKLIKTANEVDAKIVFLCNPNNPTGFTYKKEDIVKVITSVKGIVAVDEAYIEFGGETVIDLISEYDNLVVLRTMSKAFGLASIRVGFGVCGETIMELLNKVKAPYNLNSISQEIAIIALNNHQLMEKQVENIKKERTFLVSELKKLSILEVYKTKANFVFIKANEERVKKALGNKVAIRYFGNGYIRITVGTMSQNETLLELLKQVK